MDLKNFQSLRIEVMEIAKADGGKLIAPETIDAHLKNAREAAASIMAGIDEWEKLTEDELVANADRFTSLSLAIAKKFVFAPPDGLPHEPQVLEYKQWRDANADLIREAFEGALYNVSDDVYRRFNALLQRIPKIVTTRRVLSEQASKNGKKKLEKDPESRKKAEAKAGALELWKERHAGKHPKLRTVEQYATEVMHRWPILQSSTVICRWSAKWTKEVKAGKNPLC